MVPRYCLVHAKETLFEEGGIVGAMQDVHRSTQQKEKKKELTLWVMVGLRDCSTLPV